jgi:hypothetical protein
MLHLLPVSSFGPPTAASDGPLQLALHQRVLLALVRSDWATAAEHEERLIESEHELALVELGSPVEPPRPAD